jgi:hypothetical protein
MSNYAIWNVRKRHEQLTKPRKAKRIKARDRVRLGMPPVEAKAEAAAPAAEG